MQALLNSSKVKVVSLQCSACQKAYNATQAQTFSPCCQKALVTQYQLSAQPPWQIIDSTENSMWRYKAILPLQNMSCKVSLGEGMTPILPWRQLGLKYGLENVFVKDEGLNPTGSFKARGLSMAVSKALEYGIKHCVVPTAGNAGGALSAYCAKAGIKATIFMPRNTPQIFKDECRLHGADLHLVNGLIDECGKQAAQFEQETGAFNMATMKEPYRLEGKKTMGYEIAEQMQWQLPQAIIYPTGGGTGLVGIWKAFSEMKALGWLPKETKLPKMYVVQSNTCAPIVAAFKGQQPPTSFKMSVANGLSVPKAFGQNLVLQTLQQSGGTALTITDEQMRQGVMEISTYEGLLVSPEGAATWQALKILHQNKHISPTDKVLLINTGSGFKYMENL